MLAAFHRKLVSAPFLQAQFHVARRFGRADESDTTMQKNLRENAAAIVAAAQCKLPQRHHMGDRGGSVLLTDENSGVASCSGVSHKITVMPAYQLRSIAS